MSHVLDGFFLEAMFCLDSFFIMASLNEQFTAVKCYFLHGKNVAENILMLKTALKNDEMGKPKCTSGLLGLKLVTC